MRYGSFHNRFTLWIIRMLITLFSENKWLERLSGVDLLWCAGMHYCNEPQKGLCVNTSNQQRKHFFNMAYFCVLRAFVSFRYVYITSLFKLLISLIWAAFYRLCLFTLFGWSNPLRYGVISVDSIYTAFNVFYLMVMYSYYFIF